MIGLLYTAGEIVRVVGFVTSDPNDAISPARSTLLYNPMQGSIAVVVGCVPILRPFFFRRKLVQTSSGQDSGSRSTELNNHGRKINDEESLSSGTVAPATNVDIVEEHEMTMLKNAGVAPGMNTPVEEHEITAVKEIDVRESNANIEETDSQETELHETELHETELHEMELDDADVQETDMQEIKSPANSHISLDMESIIDWRMER